MRRYVVVANQTLGGEQLISKVRECLESGRSSFYILVPATPPQEHLTWTEGEASAVAQARLEEALLTFAEMGTKAEGEVGDADPLQAVGDLLRNNQFDEVIVSTLPLGISRWLGQDLPSRIERTFGLPVTHVVAERGED